MSDIMHSAMLNSDYQFFLCKVSISREGHACLSNQYKTTRGGLHIVEGISHRKVIHTPGLVKVSLSTHWLMSAQYGWSGFTYFKLNQCQHMYLQILPHCASWVGDIIYIIFRRFMVSYTPGLTNIYNVCMQSTGLRCWQNLEGWNVTTFLITW